MKGVRGSAALVVLAGALTGVSTIGMAAGEDAEEAPAVFTEAYLNDPANVEAGKAIWEERCRLCHGYASYPSTVPKLKPRRYNADFVFNWVSLIEQPRIQDTPLATTQTAGVAGENAYQFE